MLGMRVAVPHPRSTSALAVFVLALLAFGILAADLRLHGPITSADAGVGLWLHQQSHPVLTDFMRGVSSLYDTPTLVAMVAVAAMYLARMELRDWLLPLFVAVPGGMLLNAGVKHLFQRARPVLDGRVFDLASYAFPSGHTARATVWWGFLLIFWLAWQRDPTRRAAGWVIAAGMVLLAAFSRVYLGAHHLSDVLAAIAEGCAWLALCFGFVPRLQAMRRGVE
jgi:membrane-associated phospholipid phosphatase